jgi:hypothetical protein
MTIVGPDKTPIDVTDVDIQFPNSRLYIHREGARAFFNASINGGSAHGYEPRCGHYPGNKGCVLESDWFEPWLEVDPKHSIDEVRIDYADAACASKKPELPDKSTRSWGGEDAAKGEFPSALAVMCGVLNDDGKIDHFELVGTAVATHLHHALTAAHVPDECGNSIYVVPRINVKNVVEADAIPISEWRSLPGVDVVILRTKGELKDYTAIIEKSAAPGTKVISSGFGATSQQGYLNEKLMKVKLVVDEPGFCSGIHRMGTMLCARGDKGEHLCDKDSGSPLYLDNGTADTLVGVAKSSFDQSCEDSTAPAYSEFEDTATIRDCIRDVINLEDWSSDDPESCVKKYPRTIGQ